MGGSIKVSRCCFVWGSQRSPKNQPTLPASSCRASQTVLSFTTYGRTYAWLGTGQYSETTPGPRLLSIMACITDSTDTSSSLLPYSCSVSMRVSCKSFALLLACTDTIEPFWRTPMFSPRNPSKGNTQSLSVGSSPLGVMATANTTSLYDHRRGAY